VNSIQSEKKALPYYLSVEKCCAGNLKPVTQFLLFSVKSDRFINIIIQSDCKGQVILCEKSEVNLFVPIRPRR
jgi:hypothetical protein